MLLVLCFEFRLSSLQVADRLGHPSGCKVVGKLEVLQLHVSTHSLTNYPSPLTNYPSPLTNYPSPPRTVRRRSAKRRYFFAVTFMTVLFFSAPNPSEEAAHSGTPSVTLSQVTKLNIRIQRDDARDEGVMITLQGYPRHSFHPKAIMRSAVLDSGDMTSVINALPARHKATHESVSY